MSTKQQKAEAADFIADCKSGKIKHTVEHTQYKAIDVDRLKKENNQLRSVLAKLVWISDRKHDVWDNAKALLAKCPECGSDDYIQIDNEGDGLAPESTYFLCNDCGHASDPE